MTQIFVKNQWHMVEGDQRHRSCPVNLEGLTVLDSDSSLQNLRRRASKTHRYNADEGIWVKNPSKK